jgi:phosphate-selective porin OprO/OprP
MIWIFLLLQAQPAEEPRWNFSVDQNGAHLRSADGAFDLNLGGRYVLIGRFVENRSKDFSGPAATDSFRDNGFFTRQARIDFYGTLKKIWEFKVSADLVTTTPTLADGYVGYIGTPWLRLRAGQFKTPQGIEQPGSTLYTTMIERYPGDAILPGRELGLMAWGMLLEDGLKYELMLANGAVTADQNKGLGSAGGSDRLDFLMQLTLYLGRYLDGECFEDFKCGYFHQTGESDALALADLRLRDTGTRFLDFDNNSTSAGAPSPAGLVVQDGQRERDGVFFSWALGNFGVQGEWARLDMTLLDVGGARGRHTVFMWAWFADAVWILTGEKKVFNARIEPAEPLDAGGAGAWEIAVRFGQWQCDDSIVPWLEGFAFPERVTNHTFGINWWPHGNVRASLNLVYNTFKGRMHFPFDDIRDEAAALLRLQVGF